ncbi:MAG: efflux RND transporter permease subunit [Pseudomonadota bacterium]
MRRIFEFSVKQPLFVNLLTLIVIVAGVMALFRLNREVFPNINLDLVVINTAYPGATPSEIEKSITIPIEKELKKVSDLKEITSVSLEGSSVIVVEIEPDAPNKNTVVNDIQRAADRAEDLPADLKDPPLVEEIQTRNQPIVTLSMSSQTLPEQEMVKYAQALETKLLDQPMVASVERYGWRDKEIWLEVDPEKAAKYYLSLAQIINVIKERNVNVSGGSIVSNGSEQLVRTSGEFDKSEDIKKIVLRANEQGNWVQVSDIATIKDTFEREKLITRTNGQPSINLIVVKKEHGDAIQMVKDVKQLALDFSASIAGLDITLVDDLSFYIKRRLNVLISNGWVGIILVIISLFFFLSSRIALVTAVGIPIAFLTTFVAMYIGGMTINLITMVGLIIVLGMLVDDAIVVAENVFRLYESGLPPAKAAVQGALEVWKPVTTSVFTTIAAFAPLMFMSGILGKFVMYVPIVVIIALLASLFEAFVILPSHLAEMERIPSIPFFSRFKKRRNSIEGRIDSIAELNGRILGWLLKRRYKVAGITLAIFGITLLLTLKVVPFILFPSRGIDAFFIRAKAPLGTSLQKTSDLVKVLEEKFKTAMPEGEMNDFVTYIGVQQQEPNDPGAKHGDHFAQISVYLKPHVDRNYDAVELIEILKEKNVSQVNGFEEITFEKVQPGPPVGKAVEVHVRGDDFKILEKLAEQIKEYLNTLPGVSEIKDSYEPGKDELQIIVDEQATSRAGLTIADVAQAVRASIDGAIATTIRKSDEEIDVRILYPDKLRYETNVLEKILIPNPNLRLIPLTAIAKFKKTPGVLGIHHRDRLRSITVSADVDQEQATSISVMKAVEKKFKNISTNHPGYVLTFGGEWEKTMQSLRDFGYALVVACLIIFLLLTFEFQSVIQPILIMFAIPYGLVGVSWAFLAHFEPASFLAIFGVVGLSGVVVNSSIVLIDFINKQRAEGLNIDEAIIKGTHIRLRPIFLTTATTVLGVLPVAYGIMGSDPFLKPMALAIGWGLPVAAIGTLTVTPCFYRIVEDLRKALSCLKCWKNNNNHNGLQSPS